MRVSVFILLTITALPAISQVNCPPLYETREVICQGTIVNKCVPIDFICNGCWRIVWPSCKGDWKKGGNQHADSYDAALKITEDRKELFKDGNCRGSLTTDYFEFKIYLLGGNDCNNIISDRRVFSDLKSRVMSLVKDLNAEKIAFDQLMKKLVWDKLAYKPGDVVEEYHEMLKQSEKNVQDLTKILGYIANENIAEIEDEIQTLLNHQENLQDLRDQIKNDVEKQRLTANEKKNVKPKDEGLSIFERAQKKLDEEKKNVKLKDEGLSIFERTQKKLDEEKKNVKPKDEGLSIFERAQKKLDEEKKLEEEKRRRQLKLEEQRRIVENAKQQNLEAQKNSSKTNDRQSQSPKSKYGFGFAYIFWLSERDQAAFIYSDVISGAQLDCSSIKNEFGVVSSMQKCVAAWFKGAVQSSSYFQYSEGQIEARVVGGFRPCINSNDVKCFLTYEEAALLLNQEVEKYRSMGNVKIIKITAK